MLLDFDAVSDAGYYSACDGLSPASSCSSTSPLHRVNGSWSNPPSPNWSSGPVQEMSEGTYVNSHTVQHQIPARSGTQEQTAGFQHREQTPTSNIQPIQLQVPALPSIQQQRTAIPLQEETNACQLQDKRRSKTRYLGRKRHTASEREKLRMRDLTKELNHLRTYLPPSVTPAGQTLTKIQTLTLAIRYIAHLSARLQTSYVDTGVGMEQGWEACQNPTQPRAQGYPQDSPAQHIHCLQNQPRDHWNHHGDQYTHHSMQYSPVQPNQQTTTNCLTSDLQQDMTFYQVRTLLTYYKYQTNY